MDSLLRHQVEDFHYLEAELLDERKLREWFELLAEDIRYWMPIRHNTLERPSDVSEELSKPGEGYYFDDDIKALKIRVERAYSKIAWAEVPPSRTRHLITNVRIKKDDGKEMAVLAKIHLVGGSFSFQDKSLIARVIKAQAAKKKVSEADARAEIMKEMQEARKEAQDDFTKEAIDAGMKFLANPGTIEVRLAPPSPFNLMGGFMMAMTAPAQLKQQLGITITVK